MHPPAGTAGLAARGRTEPPSQIPSGEGRYVRLGGGTLARGSVKGTCQVQHGALRSKLWPRTRNLAESPTCRGPARDVT